MPPSPGDDARDLDEADDIILLFIEHPDVPADDVSNGPTFTATRPDGHTVTIHLSFSAAGAFEIGDAEFRYTMQDETTLYQIATPEHGVGIAGNMAEVFGVEESEFANTLQTASEYSQTAYDAYTEWQDTLTPRDRRLRLLDLAEEKAGDPLFSHHLDTGSFRKIGEPPDTISDLARDISEATPHHRPQKCYQNCFNTYLDYRDSDHVQYCEGIFLQKTAVSPTTHAWLEVDGHPIELTYPWHIPLSERAVYFGEALDEATITDALDYAQAHSGSLPTPLSAPESVREKLAEDPVRQRVNAATRPDDGGSD